MQRKWATKDHGCVFDATLKFKTMEMFRDLTLEEQKEFRQWARDNYEIGKAISTVWHPVTQQECHIMNEEDLADAINKLTKFSQ